MAKHRQLVFYLFTVIMWLWILATMTHGQEAPITLTVFPKVAIASTFQRTTIRVSFRIPRHKDNVQWAFSYTSDNGDLVSSQASMDGEDEPTVFPICTVRNSRACYPEVAPGYYFFSACVYRRSDKKVVKFCDSAELEVRGDEP